MSENETTINRNRGKFLRTTESEGEARAGRKGTFGLDERFLSIISTSALKGLKLNPEVDIVDNHFPKRQNYRKKQCGGVYFLAI